MRYLIVAAALLMAGPALAVDSARFRVINAADLVEVCSVPPDDPMHVHAMGFCHGYLSGSYHYYDSTEPTSNRFVCAPNPTPTRAEVMNGFVIWAKGHPQHMQDRAVDTLFRFLVETYPCKG